MNKVMIVASKYLTLGKIVGNNSVYICTEEHSNSGVSITKGDTFYYEDVELSKNITDWIEAKPIAANNYKINTAQSILIPRKLINACFIKINNGAESYIKESSKVDKKFEAILAFLDFYEIAHSVRDGKIFANAPFQKSELWHRFYKHPLKPNYLDEEVSREDFYRYVDFAWIPDQENEKPTESWRVIPFAPGYEVSSDKKIRNAKTKRSIKNGERIQLYIEGKYIQYSMHKIMKITWPELVDLDELWIPIPFAQNYEISNKKHIRNANTGKLLKMNSRGTVQLMVGGKVISRSISRMMKELWSDIK